MYHPKNYIANRIPQQRGFTLLIALILASVTLVVGLALADVAYKQIVLSSTARNSQLAFYRADSAMECALYYDQQFASFNDNAALSITCESQSITVTKSSLPDGGIKSTFNVPCAGSGQSASVVIYKQNSGTCSSSSLTGKNCIYTSGYNTCSTTDPNRFERSLRVVY
jgi:Tfp pilus assembly protein PilX